MFDSPIGENLAENLDHAKTYSDDICLDHWQARLHLQLGVWESACVKMKRYNLCK